MPDERTVNSVLAELFHNEGIHTSFMYLSEDMMNLAARIDDYDASTIIQSRHEQDAVTMADGYARHTKDIGLAVVGQGGAIGQTGSSLVTARKRGSNLLVVAPEATRTLSVDNPTTYNDPTPGIAAKDFDQTGYLRDTIEQVRSVRTPEVLVPIFKEVIRKIRLGNGPMAVTISTDVLNGDMELGGEMRSALESPTELHTDPDAVLAPGAKRIDQAVESFLDSDATKHPMVVVGRGAARETYRPDIERLAERMGAVLGTSFRGKGFFPDHPYYVGTVGETGEPLAIEYASEADYVLVLGASLNARTWDAGRLFDEDATIVHADIDDAALGRYGPIDLGIHGDAGSVAGRLADALADAGIDRSAEMWTDNLEARIAEHDPYEHVEFTDRDDALDPRRVVAEFDGILPRDRVVVVDGGHMARWVYQRVDVHSPDHLICRGDFSSIGLGLPMSIGASVGTDADTTPVLFCGDGGLLMHFQELSSAARFDIPLIIVCFNDDALAAEYHRMAPEDQFIARTEAPNLADAAAGLGCDAYRVRTPEELADIATHVDHKPDGPVVIECVVDRDVQTAM
ncbi:MAG: thiamine pyrophosphate-binding protein [Salinirussus sp.]